MVGNVHETGRKLAVTMGACDVGGGQAHGIHGLTLGIEFGRNEAEHGVLAELAVSPQVLVHGDAKDVGPVELEPAGRASEFSPVGVYHDLLFDQAFLLFLLVLGGLQELDQVHDPEGNVQPHRLDGAFRKVGPHFADFVKNLVAGALGVVRAGPAVGQYPLALLNLIGPCLGILAGEDDERVSQKLERANLVVLYVERLGEGAPVDEQPLVALLVGNDAEGVARLLDHTGPLPVLSPGNLPVGISHAAHDEGELFEHAELPFQAIEDPNGAFLTQHLARGVVGM